MNNQEVVSDFRRRWEGTYVWLNMENLHEECLVVIERVEDNNDKVATIHVTSQKFGQLVLNLGSDEHEFRFKYPPVGVFQHGVDAVSFQRRPARQYRRGICPDNSVIGNVTRRVVGNTTRFNIATVKAAFDHCVFTKDYALKMLEAGTHRSVALFGNYALSLSMDADPAHVLWHWETPVARISTKGSIASVLEKSYTQALAQGEYK
jgi:hypothetical protein